jgi:hypothetical protein
MTPRKLIKDGALRARLRKHWATAGLHLRRPGRDRTMRQRHGAWYAIDEAGNVQRSAKLEGAPDETLRALARRLGLFEPWEK